MKVTAAHAEAFQTHGYFVVEDALDGAELALLAEEADRAVADEAAMLERGGARFVPVSVLGDRYAVTGRARVNRALHRLCCSALMADVCGAALGPDAWLFSETFVCKEPHNTRGWIWHQDASYLHHVGFGDQPPNLSVWVAIDRMTEANGTLSVLPWSATGIRALVPHDLDQPWDSDAVVSFGAHQPVLLPVEAGSLVALSGLLPHASAPNRTDARRRAYLVQYSPRPLLQHGRPLQLADPLLVAGARP